MVDEKLNNILQDVAIDYAEKGIAIIPGVFTSKECDHVKSEAYYLAKQIQTNNPPGDSYLELKDNKLALLFLPATGSNYLNEIRNHPKMQQIVKFFCGSDVKQVNNQIYFREAGDEDQFAWHQDIVFRTPRDRFPDVEKGYLQTIIAIDDIELDNGAIEFIDGSHLQGEQEITSGSQVTKMLRNFKRMGLTGKKYTAKKGDLLIWNVLTVHGSESNVSEKNRMTYMNGYCSAENCLDFPYYLKDGELVERLDGVAMRKLS